MLRLDVSQMMITIWDTICDERTDKNIADDLQFLMKQFEAGNFKDYEIQAAIQILQPFDILEPEIEEKLRKDFKRLSKEKLYDIVSQLCFMYGIAHAERERIRRNERN